MDSIEWYIQAGAEPELARWCWRAPGEEWGEHDFTSFELMRVNLMRARRDDQGLAALPVFALTSDGEAFDTRFDIARDPLLKLLLLTGGQRDPWVLLRYPRDGSQATSSHYASEQERQGEIDRIRELNPYVEVVEA